MLSARSEKILNSIVGQYIVRAMPLPSQVIAADTELGVSPATIRNEMAYLEREGYLIRPHTSAGCIPSDKGYRYYVESMENVRLPAAEERQISHVFHQVENEVEVWTRLTATLLSRMVQNVAVVSQPKSADCRLKHMELISLRETEILAVIVLDGAKVKQKLITFDQAVTQATLTTASAKLNAAFAGLNRRKIAAKEAGLTDLEKTVTGHLVDIMRAEDQQEYEEPYFDGWHFMMKQPEFAKSDGMRRLMELVEGRTLLKAIIPDELEQETVHVIIGRENRDEAFQNCSVVISRYGPSEEARGTIGVVGPTRMAYSHTIPAVHYLSKVLGGLLKGLYARAEGRE